MEFLLLGPVEVRAGGRVVDCGGPRQRTVLAALAVDVGRLVVIDTVIDRVWGSTPPDRVRHALYVYVGRIREMLRRANAIDDRQAQLVRASGGYRLEIDPDCVDLQRFRRLVNEVAARSRTDQMRGALLQQALDLWRGEPLAGLTGEWTEQVRGGWRQRRLEAVLRWAEIGLETRNTAVVGRYLTELVGENPLDESLAAMLMRVLQATGRTADALDCYSNTRQRLIDQLGVDPGVDLQRTHQAILRRESELMAPQAAPSAIGVTGPAQLPPDIHGFVGRDAELAHLWAIMATRVEQPTAVVISAISGMAGVGKTALAIHFAHRNRDLFPDGQLYIDLRGHARSSPMEPIRALTYLLRALEVAPEAIPTDRIAATDLYRSLLAGKRMLVLLDNAQSADQVRPLLPGNPGCMVLVTSRVQLGGLIARDGARHTVLGVLAPTEARQLLARMLGDRISRESHAIAELIDLCGRLPLALRIVAANLLDQPVQVVADYVAQLKSGDRLAQLAVNGDEQGAVRNVFDLSYQRLEPDARRLFRMLGLVPGRDFTPVVAATVGSTTENEALRLLRRLVGVHLLAEHETGRFSFHDLLRLYAIERAERSEILDDRTTALRHLLEHHLHTADVAAGLLYPQLIRLPMLELGSTPGVALGSPDEALAWLDQERENLVACITNVAEPSMRRLIWFLVDVQRGYFWYRRLAVDWLEVADAGMTAAVAEGDLQAQAAMELCFADAYESTGQPAQAIEHLTAALSLANDAAWRDGQAAATSSLGTVYHETGRMQQAAEFHARGLAISRQMGKRAAQAVCLGNLARVNLMLGRLHLAVEQQTEALAMFRESGARIGEANTLGNLSDVHLELGALGRSQEYAINARSLHREIGDRYGEAYTSTSLAAVACHAGNQDEALALADGALILAQEIGERRAEIESLLVLGYLAQAAGRYPEATDRQHDTLRQARMSGMRYLEAQASLGLSAAHLASGNHHEAVIYAQQTITVGTDLVVLVGHARMVLAAVDLALGRRAAALDHARQAFAVRQQTGHGLARAGTLFMRPLADGADATQPWEDEHAVLRFVQK